MINSEVAICLASSCSGTEGAEFNAFLQEIREEASNFVLFEPSQENIGIESLFFLSKKLIRHKYPSIHIFIAGASRNSKSKISTLKLYEILPRGTGLEGDSLLVAGTGADSILSLLEDMFASNLSPTVSETIPKVQRALAAAMRLDQGTGGRPVLWTLGHNHHSQHSTFRAGPHH